jgi:SAM-dependent methyltransferase
MAGPADGVIDLYSRRALDFDADRTRALFEKPWLDAFLGHVPQAGSVLDLGCGSGEPIGRYVIDQGRSVTGVDAAPGLIALCRRRFPDHTWTVADMRTLDLGRRFDGLIAWHSAFHLAPSDQRAMFAVYARHLAPGAPLMFTSGSEEGETVGEWRGEPLYHGSLSTEGYRQALAGAGFDVLAGGLEDPETAGATVWLARARVPE